MILRRLIGLIAGFALLASGATAQPVNVPQIRSRTLNAKAYGVLDSDFKGAGYLPGIYGTEILRTVSLTAGSKTFQFSSIAGISVGNAVNGYVLTTGTWTAGAGAITVVSTANMGVGSRVMGEGIMTGAAATVSSVAGSSVGLTLCAGGPRCVSGYPTYAAETGGRVTFTGHGQPNGSIVTDISGSGPYTITVSKPATFTGSQQIIFDGIVVDGGQWN